MLKNAKLAAALMLWPMAVQAQEKLPSLPEMMALVQDAEVYVTGFIGRGPEGVARFVLPDAMDNGFPVDFKSEEDLDTRIKGCGFDGSGGLPCKVAAYGYLNWDAARLHVVITSIESLGAPTARE